MSNLNIKHDLGRTKAGVKKKCLLQPFCCRKNNKSTSPVFLNIIKLPFN